VNAHPPKGHKLFDMKGNFYDVLECVLDKFPKYHKIILLYLNAKIYMEDIFKTTIGNESLHEISIDNGVRVVNFVQPKILLSKVQCSHIVKIINLLGHLLMERHTTKLIIF
jgi:hypothetical protein